MELSNRQKAAVWLDEIDDEGSGLSDWEADFIDSMLKKVEGNTSYQPTDRELSKIKQILDERVHGEGDDRGCDGDLDDDWGDR